MCTARAMTFLFHLWHMKVRGMGRASENRIETKPGLLVVKLGMQNSSVIVVWMVARGVIDIIRWRLHALSRSALSY
jgi:hypothetical protein